MEVKLISKSFEPDLTAAAAAVGCYSAKDPYSLLKKMDSKRAGEVLKVVMESGHHSVVEHAVFTFSVKGVSRALTHQLVRHRVASYSQQSQRYVRIEEPDVVVPPSIERDKKKKEMFMNLMKNIWELYKGLTNSKVPVEDARYILPNATRTNITITMNARSLLNFFSIRCCVRAQWEIRELAYKMLEIVKKEAPLIFKNAGASCEMLGYCPEGEKSCGRYPTLEELKKKAKSSTTSGGSINEGDASQTSFPH